MNIITRLASAALLCSAAGISFAQGHDLGDLHIDRLWSRATVAGVPNGAAYFTVDNHGPQDDRLLSAEAPVADRAELHTHIKDGEIMRMRQVEHIDIPAGGSVALAPGGLHVMLMALKAPLQDGSHFPLTLNFEKAGTITIDVPVELRRKAQSHDHDHDHDHDHKHH
ncbi:MAG: copper chaperone PCu(A)C [Castellaniella sp.]